MYLHIPAFVWALRQPQAVKTSSLTCLSMYRLISDDNGKTTSCCQPTSNLHLLLITGSPLVCVSFPFISYPLYINCLIHYSCTAFVKQLSIKTDVLQVQKKGTGCRFSTFGNIYCVFLEAEEHVCMHKYCSRLTLISIFMTCNIIFVLGLSTFVYMQAWRK